MKLNATHLKQVKAAKKRIDDAAEILQQVQDETVGYNSEASATLEEIGISLGFCINEIEENLFNN